MSSYATRGSKIISLVISDTLSSFRRPRLPASLQVEMLLVIRHDRTTQQPPAGLWRNTLPTAVPSTSFIFCIDTPPSSSPITVRDKSTGEFRERLPTPLMIPAYKYRPSGRGAIFQRRKNRNRTPRNLLVADANVGLITACAHLTEADRRADRVVGRFSSYARARSSLILESPTACARFSLFYTFLLLLYSLGCAQKRHPDGRRVAFN